MFVLVSLLSHIKRKYTTYKKGGVKMRVVEDDGLRISDYMWEEMKLQIPKSIDNRLLRINLIISKNSLIFKFCSIA